MAGSWWRRATLAGAVVAVAASLASCGQPVSVEPAPSASEPVCAELLLRLPDVLVNLSRRSTTSQASRAWGKDDPVVLRCGVTPLAPTTDPCLSIPDDGGENPIDWVASTEATDGMRVFTSYGRVPAVEVSVPDSQPADAVLSALADAVALLPQQRECL